MVGQSQGDHPSLMRDVDSQEGKGGLVRALFLQPPFIQLVLNEVFISVSC